MRLTKTDITELIILFIVTLLTTTVIYWVVLCIRKHASTFPKRGGIVENKGYSERFRGIVISLVNFSSQGG